jgi:hypothetical protein
MESQGPRRNLKMLLNLFFKGGGMTPVQKIKYAIVSLYAELEEKKLGDITEANIDAFYDDLVERDEHWDAMREIRTSYDCETNIECEYSRHYETKSVAKKMADGSWVGWTYYYGGGKYAEPEAVEWVENVYALNCREEEKVMVVRTFEKINKE